MSIVPFPSPTPHQAVVSEQLENFYPISTRMLFQLRVLAVPVAKALSVFLSSSQNDIGKETTEVKSKDNDYQQRTTLQPITADLAQKRHEQKTQALEQLVGSVMNEQASGAIAELVMDSMRDRYPRGPRTATVISAFLTDITAEQLVEMLTGVAGANRKLFDPLRARVADLTAALKSNIDGMQASEQPSEPSSSPAETTLSGQT